MKWAATLAVAAASLCLASAQKCSGCEDVGDTCLSFINTATGTWHGMDDLCGDRGVGCRLATVQGSNHHAVVEHIKKTTSLHGKDFWIGGRDESHTQDWRWVTDESPVPWMTPHWYPCINGGKPEAGYYHIALKGPDYYYHSADAAQYLYGICGV